MRVLVGVLATWFVAIAIQRSRAAEAGSLPREPNNSLSDLLLFLPDDTVAGAIVCPAQLLAAQTVQQLPVGLVVADVQHRYGLDLTQLEVAIPFVEQAAFKSPRCGVILRFRDSVDWRAMPPVLLDQTAFGEINGKPYRRGRRATDYSLYSLDAQTMIIATDETLERMLSLRDNLSSASHAVESVAHVLLAGVDKQIDLHAFVIVGRARPFLNQLLDQVRSGSESWSSWERLAEATDRVEIRVRLTQQLAAGAILSANPSLGVDELQTRCTAWIASFLGELTGQASTGELSSESGPLQLATAVGPDTLANYSCRVLTQVLSQCKPVVAGDTVQLGCRGNAVSHASACAAVTMLLGPTFDATIASVGWLQQLQMPVSAPIETRGPSHAGIR
ncbi:MAG: hypothetical protein KDA92_03700 [Planctomycetales bacterium]|nr:hypothetical protein [Planctomycetales bacterium]